MTDLRIIVFPDSKFSLGKIVFGLIAHSFKIHESSQEFVTHQLLQLIHSFFEEYEARTLSEDEIADWLHSFSLNDCILLRRQSRWVSLEQPNRGEEIFGFRPYPLPISREQNSLVWGMSTFAPDSIDWRTVSELLLRQSVPLLISICCQPTNLQTEDVQFIQGQLFQCENFVMRETQPTLRDQAKVWQRHLWNWYQRLDDATAIIAITLASPSPIAPTVSQAIGALMSCISDEEQKSLLGSGWKAIVPKGGEKQRVIWGIENCVPVLLPVPDAPETAQRLTYLFDPVEASAVFLLPPHPTNL